jgi:hypothetical protein
MFFDSFFDPEDRWPSYAVGPLKHLHALGVAALNFSYYEGAIIILFEMYLPKDLAKFLFDSLNNQERTQFVRELISTYEKDTKLIDHIEYLITHFSECSKNRHMLLHARPTTPFIDDLLHIEKQARNNPNTLLTYRLSLTELRQIADDMMQGVDYVLSIWRYRASRDQLAGGRKVFAGTPTLSLPEKPPRPHIVSPHQHPEDREEQPAQPVPSGE